MLQNVGPRPLIEPDKLVTESDWIEAGRRVFGELDHFRYETQDPKLISAARTRDTFDPSRTTVLPDGTVFGMRWVPTKAVWRYLFTNCANCHVAYLKDGLSHCRRANFRGRRTAAAPLLFAVHEANHLVPAASRFAWAMNHSECACIARNGVRGRRSVNGSRGDLRCARRG